MPFTQYKYIRIIDFWTDEYIWIYVCKFFKIWIYLNVFSQPYFNFFLSIFLLDRRKSRCLAFAKRCLSNPQRKEMFPLNSKISINLRQPEKYVVNFAHTENYRNSLNKMTLEYYLYSYLCYIRSTNILGYSLGKYVASKYIRIFIRYILWHPNKFGYLFVSTLWYSLITNSTPFREGKPGLLKLHESGGKDKKLNI